MTKEELLKVLDMSEDEQWVWCVKNPKFVGESLADLAFRLRDEAMNFNKGAWYEATEQVWKECHNYREYRNFWVDRSKPIHWIIAALIAKESK